MNINILNNEIFLNFNIKILFNLIFYKINKNFIYF